MIFHVGNILLSDRLEIEYPQPRDSHLTSSFKLLKINMWMFKVSAEDQTFNLGLVVVDMQNGFVSKGGSYDLLGMNTQEYQRLSPKPRS